jgi:hypothetical protein
MPERGGDSAARNHVAVRPDNELETVWPSRVKYPHNADDNNGDCESPYDNRFPTYPSLIMYVLDNGALTNGQYPAINNNGAWNGTLFVQLTCSHYY